MNINFGGLKQDYSFLFSSMNSSRNSSNNLLTSINLSDYNSIKTGTYGKLLKDIWVPVHIGLRYWKIIKQPSATRIRFM